MPESDIDERNAEWVRTLEAFEIDDDSAEFTFADRLASEQGWTSEFTDQAILEYKRFIALMVLADHPVTPSLAVDHVWHLHLTYTYSYHVRLCEGLVGKTLHHMPTKGGAAEREKFCHQYDDTLKAYEHFIGMTPPRAIWPPTDERFRSTITRSAISEVYSFAPFLALSLIAAGAWLALKVTESPAEYRLIVGVFFWAPLVLTIGIVVARDMSEMSKYSRRGHRGTDGHGGCGGCGGSSGCGGCGGCGD